MEQNYQKQLAGCEKCGKLTTNASTKICKDCK